MRQKLGIRVSKHLAPSQSLSYKQLKVRERLLNWMLGKPVQVSVIIPGHKKAAVEITRIGGYMDGHDEKVTSS